MSFHDQNHVVIHTKNFGPSPVLGMPGTVNGALQRMEIAGKSIQAGTPSPSSPATLESCRDFHILRYGMGLKDVGTPVMQALRGIVGSSGGWIAQDKLIIDESGARIERRVGCIEAQDYRWIFNIAQPDRVVFYCGGLTDYGVQKRAGLCSHFPLSVDLDWTRESVSFLGSINVVVMRSTIGATPSDTATALTAKFKDWLAARKAEGNPMVVQYVLSETVNESIPSVPVTTAQYGTTMTTDSPLQPELTVRAWMLGPPGYQYPQVYGVRFSGGNPTGVRLLSAAGKVAEVGTDTQEAVNDFDGIAPWGSRRRCCGGFGSDGAFAANAYQGQAGYAADGSNGEVWVENALFYTYRCEDAATEREEIYISDRLVPGFSPAPLFMRRDGAIKQRAYTAAYPMAVVNGKATTRSGVYSRYYQLNSAIAAARTMGDRYATTTAAEWYTECLLMWVEFATRDLQSVMRGACRLPYTAGNKAVIAETNTNRVIVAAALAEQFVVNQTIGIGPSFGSTTIAEDRAVTAIVDYDGNTKAICFDGTPVNIAAGDVVISLAWKNGSCDGVLSSSGSQGDNASGKYNCVYRGREAPYGNASSWISDILMERTGIGTAESPYAYNGYFLPDPAKYNGGNLTGDYIKLGYTLATADGYVKRLGYDSRFPQVRLPVETGGAAFTYYGDNYYKPGRDLCAAHVGGYWSQDTYAGPCYWGCSAGPAEAGRDRRARLAYID